MEECFYGIARAVYDLVLDYAKLEVSDLCSDRENVARSWKNRGKMVGNERDGSVFVVGQNEMVSRCSFQLATEMKC